MKVEGRRREVSMDICSASQNFSGRVQIEFEAENLKQHLVDFPREGGVSFVLETFCHETRQALLKVSVVPQTGLIEAFYQLRQPSYDF